MTARDFTCRSAQTRLRKDVFSRTNTPFREGLPSTVHYTTGWTVHWPPVPEIRIEPEGATAVAGNPSERRHRQMHQLFSLGAVGAMSDAELLERFVLAP